MADAAAQQIMSVLFFGEACTDPADMPSVQALLSSEMLQSAESMFAQAQAAHQLLQSAKEQQPHVEHFMRPPKPPDWCEPRHLFIRNGHSCSAASWRIERSMSTGHERQVCVLLVLLRSRATMHLLV